MVGHIAALVAVVLIASEPPEVPSSGLPHLSLDPDRRFVDLEASIIKQTTPEGQWLELLACTEGGPEHESVMIVKARPSHIHLALLLLGLEPGSPMSWRLEYDKVTVDRLPTGPPIAVTAIYRRGQDRIEVPVNQWIYNRHSKQPLAENIWLFTGSQYHKFDGKKTYMADASGTVLSLVNFGDELLARPNLLTNRSDEEAWAAVKQKVPPVGTELILRLRPIKKEMSDCTGDGPDEPQGD